MENILNINHPSYAIANISGSPEYSNITGTAIFKKKNNGVLVTVEVWGLPHDEGRCDERVFALHIHNGESCTGNNEDPFADAGTHLNLEHCPHPEHTGDLPPLFGNQGYAYLSVFTNRFTLNDIIGKVIIIHENPDDFTTQPSGNAGKKIACGKIKAL